jgi:hypothetical protein
VEGGYSRKLLAEVEILHRLPGAAEVAPQREALDDHLSVLEGSAQVVVEGSCGLRVDLVLDGHVWRELPPVLGASQGSQPAAIARRSATSPGACSV